MVTVSYENRKLIIKTHCKLLLNLQEQYSRISRYIIIQRNVRELEACNQPVEYCDTLLMDLAGFIGYDRPTQGLGSNNI